MTIGTTYDETRLVSKCEYLFRSKKHRNGERPLHDHFKIPSDAIGLGAFTKKGVTIVAFSLTSLSRWRRYDNVLD